MLQSCLHQLYEDIPNTVNTSTHQLTSPITPSYHTKQQSKLHHLASPNMSIKHFVQSRSPATKLSDKLNLKGAQLPSISSSGTPIHLIEHAVNVTHNTNNDGCTIIDEPTSTLNNSLSYDGPLHKSTSFEEGTTQNESQHDTQTGLTPCTPNLTPETRLSLSSLLEQCSPALSSAKVTSGTTNTSDTSHYTTSSGSNHSCSSKRACTNEGLPSPKKKRKFRQHLMLIASTWVLQIHSLVV